MMVMKMLYTGFRGKLNDNITSLKYFPGSASYFKFRLSGTWINTTFILYVLLKKFGYCAPKFIFATYSSQV